MTIEDIIQELNLNSSIQYDNDKLFDMYAVYRIWLEVREDEIEILGIEDAPQVGVAQNEENPHEIAVMMDFESIEFVDTRLAQLSRFIGSASVFKVSKIRKNCIRMAFMYLC